MGRAKKVVLAYSGGVDTSVCIPYLKQEWGVEDVITFAADLGQGDELEPIRQKALDAGASQSLVGDLIQPFIEDFAFPAIRANALYEGRYPLHLCKSSLHRLAEHAPGLTQDLPRLGRLHAAQVHQQGDLDSPVGGVDQFPGAAPAQAGDFHHDPLVHH